MCGIFFAVSHKGHVWPSETAQRLLEARGPDAVNRVAIPCHRERQDCLIFLSAYSTVLSLRGSTVVSQPYQTGEDSSALCWNGEAWSVQSSQTVGNDTIAIFDLLKDALRTVDPEQFQDPVAICSKLAEVMSRIAGPYAFVFYHEASGKVYFGRDFLGRRSLLQSVSEDGSTFILSSVADPTLQKQWVELEADGVYCLDIDMVASSSTGRSDHIGHLGSIALTKAPYNTSPQLNAMTVIPTLSLNRQFSPPLEPLFEQSRSVERLENLLRQSLLPRVLNIPEPPGPSCQVAGTPTSSLAVLFSGGLDCTVLARMSHDLVPSPEPIDLLNVAFENPRVHKAASKEASAVDPYELCPDRITGRASYEELRRVCPEREWRFVAINIPYSETQAHRQEILTLMFPHNTEMDLSISLALYFAARGIGYLSDGLKDSVIPYTTSARVLLSGLGADELFAGYTRHATAFKRHGYSGLLDELSLDIGRLGKRNLGRDDRIISSWAKEARFPYLDERLVAWALAAPITDKCGFELPTDLSATTAQGSHTTLEPGKKVLRCLALKLGMPNVATEKKRAIQFGARTAKMETGKTKGTQVLSS